MKLPPEQPLDQRLDLANISRQEFINAMAHLYRGQLADATAWRSRIDTTSHWAVVLSATALSFVFSDNSSDRHVLIPIISLFCTSLLLMEARRYRFYDIWRSRARMIEINFYRPMLTGISPAQSDWAERLAQDLAWPLPHLPWWEAVGRRLRRNYQWIFGILFVSWFIVLMTHPTSTNSVSEMVNRAAVGPISGWIVFVGMLAFYTALLALGLYSFWSSRIKHDLPAGHPDRMAKIHRK